MSEFFWLIFLVSSPSSLTTMRFPHSSSINTSLVQSSKFPMSSILIQSSSSSTMTFFSEESYLSILPVLQTPSFDGNLPVSRFPFFISRFLSQNNISLLFQNNHANQVYLLYLLHTVKRSDFGQFFKFLFIFFSSIPLFECCFWKKTFSPSCRAFQIRCTATHTWHAVKSLNIGLNIGEFGIFSGWLWTIKKKLLFLKYDLTSY